MKNNWYFFLPVIFSVIFFIIPFFWLQPGEMDLGGDNSRLYFYDPLAYLASQSSYSITHSGLGGENLSYYAIPIFLLLAAAKTIIQSPTNLISAFHGMSLSIAFISVYLIVKELLQSEKKETPYRRFVLEIAAVTSGLFYNLSPVPILNWGYVILTYNQVFLNPLMFFLLLRFFITRNIRYLLIVLCISFIFSPNFTYVGAPPFFSFYPISFIFLFFYTKYIKKTPIPIKKLLIGVGLFILIQSFHLIPQIVNLLSPGSSIHQIVFSDEGKIGRGLGYFSSIAPLIKLSLSLLTLPHLVKPYALSWVFIVFPLLIVLGFLWNKRKTYLLSSIFFLTTLFFYTGNITDTGINFYASLYNIPGFAMFRNFYGQWQWTYLFYFSLILGQAVAIVLHSIEKRQRYVLLSILVIILVSSSWPFISGKLHDTTHWQSKGVRSHVKMDPQYEEMLAYIRELPIDGKILSLPLTDPGYQVVKGVNNAAYEGPSTITYLAGRNEFMGAEEFEFFGSSMLLAARDKDYHMFKTILGMLNIKYIYYNEDPFIYTKNYPGQPYANVRKFLPDTQERYKEFIQNLGVKEIKIVGSKYHLYEINDASYLPHIYTAERTVYWNDSLTNLYFPISFYASGSSIAFYDRMNSYENNKYMFDDIFLKAGNKSPIFDFFKKKKLTNFVSPTVSQKLSSPIYPLAVLREKKDLERYNTIDDSFIDRSIYFAEKRINELTSWSNEIPLSGGIKSTSDLTRTWKEPELWEFTKYKNYNSWEVTLARYQLAMEKLVSLLEDAKQVNYSSVTYNTNKIELKSVLLAHKERLRTNILKDEIRSAEEKNYLLHLIEEMYIDILVKLNPLLPDYKKVPYEVEKPLQAGTYEVYLNKKDIDNLRVEGVGIMVNGKRLLPIFSENSTWIRFEDVKVIKEESLPLFLTIDEESNLTEQTEWRTLERNNVGTDSATLTSSYDFLGDQTGLIREISSWHPESMYMISFDYFTGNDNFSLSVFERGGTKTKPFINNVYKESLKSPEWKNFVAVFLSGKEAKSAFIQISKNQEDIKDAAENKKIEMRNLSVIRFPDPQIILKKVIKPTESSIPKITFTRVNPTKYKVHIRGANDPYALILSQRFNQKWKVYLSDESISTDPIPKVIKSYGNGSLQEGKHQNIFMNVDTFETWGKNPIAQDTHLIANGYANSWYIEPEDVQNKSDYTLIIEMNTQQLFYVSFFVSFIGLLLIVFLFIKSYIK